MAPSSFGPRLRLDGEEGVRGGEQARVVVEVVDDLPVGAVGEVPVGNVALPHLVRKRGLEADEEGLGALLRLGRDQYLVTRSG